MKTDDPNYINYLKEIIKSVNSREEFVSKYPKDYKRISRVKGLIKNLIGHFPFKTAKKITNQELSEIALKYRYKIDFYKNNNSEYDLAYRRGILDDICSHMESKLNRYDKNFISWLKKEAKICKTYTEFNDRNPGLYKNLKKRRPDLFKIIKNLKKIRPVHTSIGERSLRIYLNKLLNIKLKKQRPKWLINPKTKKRLELDGYCTKNKIAFEHNSGYHFGNEERDAQKVIQCKNHNIVLIIFPDIKNQLKYDSIEELEILIKNKLIGLGLTIVNPHAKFKWFYSKQQNKWSITKLKKTINKYTKLKDFIKNEISAYSTCRHLRLQHLFAHLEKSHRTTYKLKYSDSFLLKKALKYPNLTIFMKKEKKFCKAFKKRKHLEIEYKKIKNANNNLL